MGAAPGNQNAKGNKGGGRKGTYEEAARAKLLVDAWFEEGIDVKKYAEHVESGLNGEKKLQLFKLYVLKAIKDNRILASQADKLFPSKVTNNLTGELNIIVTNYQEEEKPEEEKTVEDVEKPDEDKNEAF